MGEIQYTADSPLMERVIREQAKSRCSACLVLHTKCQQPSQQGGLVQQVLLLAQHKSNRAFRGSAVWLYFKKPDLACSSAAFLSLRLIGIFQIGWPKGSKGLATSWFPTQWLSTVETGLSGLMSATIHRGLLYTWMDGLVGDCYWAGISPPPEQARLIFFQVVLLRCCVALWWWCMAFFRDFVLTSFVNK